MKNDHVHEGNLQQIAEGSRISPEINSHLKECELCREKLDQYRHLYHFLKMTPPIKLRPDFVHHIMNMLPRKKVRFSYDYFWIVLSSMVAAGILIYFVGLQTFFKSFNSVL